ncbi:MAG: M56 family metallopeptidase [Thermostichales cyanobacterium SZTDM-1c_bins_54]
MIHALVLVGALLLAVGARYGGWWFYEQRVGWWQRWPVAVLTLALPPLLLLSSTWAVVWMGVGGMMAAGPWGAYSYGLAALALGGAVLLLAWLAVQGYRSEAAARQLPRRHIQDWTVHVAPDPTLWAAQVGCWDPCLVVSQGVLDRLGPNHLRAVLLHEQAHQTLGDPWLFLLLGWLRRWSWWLPKTEGLWQEVLVLREFRADAWTVRYGDNLDLAEALWIFAAQHQPQVQQQWAIGLASGSHAWQERLEAILAPGEHQTGIPLLGWLLPLLPLLLVPLHH